ncbi:MFS transporter, UMF1 family [Reichenbachiella faecimaris]|uniref:MFS transporter, UMF1 family n=1 Tax=Reichenbachiella faecimaris TaxID=692418 RepID=A0A1W2G8P6_REIFA|nr:MFS transporter [Reichenbachiella faecimaris]SMD32812.1 MFS transporter, UMF1 family [Reichenbachiella faecimaris]
MILNDKKTINAWCSYDWANSVYNLIVTTAIFPIYYNSATEAAFGGNVVRFFGCSIDSSVLYSYAISFSFLIAVLLYPVLSGVADYRGSKKAFMRFFTYLGSLACIGLYFFEGSNIEYGILLAITASLGYASSVVFYNAFLPEIASEDQMDRVSAKGFSMGYIGSVLLLIVSLVLVSIPETFGFDGAGSATRFVFLLVGIWWFGFAHIAFSALKDNRTHGKITGEVLRSGFNELKKVFSSLKENVNSIRFLYSFFFYSMGVQTVMLLAPLFAAEEIGMESSEMIIVILIIQLVAVGGAYLFATISDKKGNKISISLAVMIWFFICILAYFIADKTVFYGLAGLLGLVMGGIQSISRSTYSKLIPEGTKDTASYFSFYDVTEKFAIVLGTLGFGYILQLTGTMRNSMLFMGLFFVIGLIILSRAKLNKGTA